MREEISEWEVDSIKPVSNQFKTTFYPPAIMECRLCRTTSGGDSHLDISVIPLLGHRLYTCEYRLCQCKGGVVTLKVLSSEMDLAEIRLIR
jgi:hypothetical protein